MEDFLKGLADAGPRVARFVLLTVVATIISGIAYDRLIRGEGDPSVRDIAPMLVVMGLIGGWLLNWLLPSIVRK